MRDDATDAELLQVIAAQSEQARAAEALLCRRYGARVRLYGLRHLRDEERARDLVQSVLLAVLKAARDNRVEAHDKLDRFVLGTCRNTVLKMREQSARTRSVTEAELAALHVPPREVADLTALLRCFSVLEERAQVVVRLSFQEERSADEVASALSITTGNVRVIRHRALAALRQCLDHQPEAPGSAS